MSDVFTYIVLVFKRFIFLTGVFLLHHSNIHANAVKKNTFLHLDSLKNVLVHTKGDSVIVSNYLEHWVDYYPADVDAKLTVLNWCLAQSKKLKNPYLIAETYYNFGQHFFMQDDFKTSSKYCAVALKYADKHAIAYVKKLVYGTLAGIYYRNGQFDHAETYALKSLDLALKEKNNQSIFSCYNRLAIILLSNQRDSSTTKKGFYYIEKTIEAAKHEQNPELLARTHSSFGGILTDMHMYETAMQHFEKSMAINKDHLYPLVDVSNYLHMGNIFKFQKKYALAKENYTRGILLAKKIENKTYEYNLYYQLSDLYEKEGNYSEAYSTFEKYTALHDSIVNAENFSKAADVQNQYEREKKQKQILQLNKNNQIKKLRIERDGLIRKKLYFVIVGIVLVSCILIVFVFVQLKNIREKRNAYNILQQKNIAIQHQSEKLNQQAKLISTYQSQMNPRFVFNAVNGFRHFVLTDEKEKSITQLQRFAKLMRQTLENSEKDFISLPLEVAYLHNYIQFEQAQQTLTVLFHLNAPDDGDELLIPPMVLQPFLEHAITEIAKTECTELTVELLFTVTHFLEVTLRIQSHTCLLSLPQPDLCTLLESRLRLLHEIDAAKPINTYFSITQENTTGFKVMLMLPLTYAY